VRIRLRFISLIILVLSFAVWGFSGFHRGWSKSTVTKMEIDEITGLEYPVTVNSFVFGLEILGVLVLIACVCLGTSYAFKKNTN
jgi:hypothetical protein|tara:strand:+ start:2058 stop:2309 length:252 start_codon:yes stop_codon:yes gene_type:complete